MIIREVKKSIVELTSCSSINSLNNKLKDNFYLLRFIWIILTSLIFCSFILLVLMVEKATMLFYILCSINLLILAVLLIYIGYKKGAFGIKFSINRVNFKIVEVEVTEFHTIWFGYDLRDNNETIMQKLIIKNPNYYPKHVQNSDYFVEEFYFVSFSKPFIKNQLYLYKDI